jgi:hypothetical protein
VITTAVPSVPFVRRRATPVASAATVALALVVATVAAPAAVAQRAQGKFDWQGRTALFDCGVPRVGKHTIAEVEVGKTWRLGAGPSSILTTGAPLIADDKVVPPGAWRVQLLHSQAKQFDLLVEGAGRFVSNDDSTVFKGSFVDAKAPTSKLEIALAPSGDQPDKELRPLLFTATFGSPQVTVPFAIVGSVAKKASGATVDGFKLPAEWVAKQWKAGHPAPVATLTVAAPAKDAPKAFNVMLGENDVQLVGQDVPSQNAFAALDPHDKKWDRKGTVAWSDAPEAADHFVVDDVKFEKGKELRLTARLGKKKAEITIPLGGDPK